MAVMRFTYGTVRSWGRYNFPKSTVGDQGVILAFRGFIVYRASIGLPIGDDDWTNITHGEYQKYLFSGRTVYFNPLRYQFVPMPPVSVAHILLESTDSEQKPERGENDLSEIGSANVLLESTDESDNFSEPGEINNSFVLDENNNPCPSYEPDKSYASDVLSTAFANPNSFMGSDSC